MPLPDLLKLPYKALDRDKEEIRVLRFPRESSTNRSEEKIQCFIDNVPLKESLHNNSIFRSSENKENLILEDEFTNCIDSRDSSLERPKGDDATSMAQAGNIIHRRRSRYSWGDFEALSYTWGNEDIKKEIAVNGVHIDVPINLEQALRALRDLEETSLGMCYWVDSLCINQENIDEKNMEIKRMKDIYSQARAVVVWLGQADETAELAVASMRRLCHGVKLSEPVREGSAILEFMKKDYWNRSWIIQELAMNHRSTLILCGKSRLTRRMIRFGTEYCKEILQEKGDLSKNSDWNPDSDPGRMARRVYYLINLTYESTRRPDLLDHVLSLVRRADAKKHKDKVYSIMGLLDPDISKHIKPDYSLSVSVQQVYTDFITSIISRTGGLLQIMLDGIPTCKGWPSWVPDWTKPIKRQHIKHLARCKASGKRPAKFRFTTREQNDHHLVCIGYQVDEVDGIAAEPSPSSQSTQPSTSSNRYGNRLSRALRQTLVMNRPGASKHALLKVPWILKPDTGTNTSNFLPNSEWSKLSNWDYFKKFDAFRKHNESFCIGGRRFGSFFPQEEKDNIEISSAMKIIRWALLCLEGRALITTKTGYLGLAPIDVFPRDVVAILLGAPCPVILRPCGKDLYQIVGECYIHRMMNGEIFRQEAKQKAVQREFILC